MANGWSWTSRFCDVCVSVVVLKNKSNEVGRHRDRLEEKQITSVQKLFFKCFSTRYIFLIVFKFYKENLFLPHPFWAPFGRRAGWSLWMVTAFWSTPSLKGSAGCPESPHSIHKNFTPWSCIVHIKDCMGWLLPERSSSTVVIMEFKVCHNGKVSKDLHHLATFYSISIYFLWW